MKKRSPELVFTVTANFTAEPVGNILHFWTARLGLEHAKLVFSAYNQVFQELAAPNSLLASTNPGVNFLLIRFEDWARDQTENLRSETITAAVSQFVEAFEVFAQRARRHTVLFLSPPSQSATADPQLVMLLKSLEDDVRSATGNIRGLSVIGADDVTSLYPIDAVNDPHSDRQGHIPFTQNYWVALGTTLIRKARTLLHQPHKVIAVDADNTLWGGVAAEAGSDEVQISGGWRAVQEFLRGLKRQGMLLTLVSKNREEDVAEVFKRPDMLLRREDFVAWKVNWEPKSHNLRELASELELGLDSFIFIDDSPIECAEVAANLPSVTVIQLPSRIEDALAFFRHVWAFDLPPATSADDSRTEQYQQQAKRKQVRADAGSFSDFIERLELFVSMAAPTTDQLNRAAQLTQRTNQFNATGVRRTSAELGALLTSGERGALIVRVRDRFGDYGEVGLCVYAPRDGDLWVDTFLLSCRVLNKGVEHRMMAELGKIALDLGKDHVAVPFHRTNRNEPAEKFLDSIGAAFRSGEDLYRFPAAEAKAIFFDPNNTAETLPSASNTVVTEDDITGVFDFGEIANHLRTVHEIQEAIWQKEVLPRPSLAVQFAPPRNQTEEKLTEIWADVLRLDVVGVNDNFFDLGGDSVRLVRVHSELKRILGSDLSIIELFRCTTVRSLAKHLVGSAEPPAPPRPDQPATGGRKTTSQRRELRLRIARQLGNSPDDVPTRD